MTAAPVENGEAPRPEWPNDLAPGTWISGRYLIVRCIGSGGVGAVYEAEQRSLGRQVAIKFLHPEQLRRANGKERFEREARTAASINHPHVVAIYDFDTHQGVPYLVMELLRGQTVEQLLATCGRLPLQRGLPLLLGASRGLEALHASGLVHRDLKPANLFVTLADGAEHCKILDFGISKQRESNNLTTSTELVGTPAYMAPERIERPAEADGRADIYALAVTAYEMFTGHDLQEGTPHEILLRVMAGTLPPRSTFTDVMPEELAQLLYRCLSRRPEDRPQTAAALGAELEHILRGLSGLPAEKPLALGSLPAAPTTSPKKRRRALPLALLGGALLVSLAAFLFITHGPRQAAPRAPAPANATTPSAGAASDKAASDKAASDKAASETPPPPVERSASSPAEIRPAAPQLAAHRPSGASAATAAAGGLRKNDSERASAFVPKNAALRASTDPAADAPTPSASAASRLPVDAPHFAARSAPPQFVPRADTPATAAKDRQPLDPGHLFRPRPSK